LENYALPQLQQDEVDRVAQGAEKAELQRSAVSFPSLQNFEAVEILVAKLKV
jgi:hypothetical protein